MSINIAVIAAMALALDPSYVKSVEDYRQKAEQTLKSDSGWLTVVGLHWLKPGATTFGSAAGNDFVLPAGKAPQKAGVFHFDGKTVRLEAAGGSGIQVNGKPFREGTLQDDSHGAEPDKVTLGDLTITVIERGGRIGLRLRDRTSKYRQHFTHRSWYPIKPEYHVKGKFLPYPQPKMLRIPTVIDGVVEEHESPGEIEFQLGGKTNRAQVLKSGPNELWLIFRDRTSGKETYPAGRFLYGDLLAGGTVRFDFNKAYNPPCAFTPFATCPLPPRQNSLAIPIPAGELTYHVEE
jgi:uncharacterized protein (DUF1684 family)